MGARERSYAASARKRDRALRNRRQPRGKRTRKIRQRVVVHVRYTARWPDGPSCGDIGRKTFPFASEENPAIRVCPFARVPEKPSESFRLSNGECRGSVYSFLFDFPRRIAPIPARASAWRADFERPYGGLVSPERNALVPHAYESDFIRSR